MTAGRYRDAVLDFNRYEEANGGSIANANFYYMRGQAELGGKMYQQALNDFEMSIYLEPENPLYYIEKGVLCYRVRLVDEGIRSLEKAKELAAGAVDVYYLLGCLYAGNGENVLAKENLEKAKELGHPGAEEKLNELK
jgi:tetratricopeptide (TPR) repeat protein